jgi:uncharacterized protein (DUF1697 family)
MPQFIVLLRGVNVGKAKRVPMAAFQALLQDLGHEDVRTLLNSGNAVFRSPARSTARHAQRIAAALVQRLDVQVPVVVKSAAELAAVVDENPFALDEAEHARFLVAFAQEAAPLAALAPLQSLVQAPERFAIGAHAAYLHCAAGLLESRAGAALLGKLGQGITSRNWATTLKLRALCEAAPRPRSPGHPSSPNP